MTRPSPHRTAALCALVAAVAAAALVACSRIELSALDSGAPLEAPDAGVAALYLRPAWFEVLGDAEPSPELADAARIHWQATTVISEMLDEETEVLLPDLMATFELDALPLAPDTDRLAVDASYTAPPLRASLRFKQAAGDTFCRVDLDLGTRALAFDLVPGVRDGVPAWTAQMRAGLSSDAPLGWTAVESCPFDLQSVDWSSIAAHIDADLAAQATATYIPALRALIVDELALPRAGLRLTPRESGFFWPLALTVATRTADTVAPPWSGDALELAPETGLRIALDLELIGDPAPCAAALGGPPGAALPLAPHQAPALTPTGGAPWVAALAIDAAFAQTLLHELARSGVLCADLDATMRGELPPIDTLVSGLGAIPGFDFGRRGRLRVQPSAGLALGVLDSERLRLVLEGLRLELYAETDEALLVRVALLDGRFELDLTPRVDAQGTLVVTAETAAVALTTREVALLGDLDADALASDLVETLVERSVAVPLPRPFGRTLALLELEARSGALWAYFGW